MALTRVALQKTTLLDFPGEVAATVFTPGCNLRCPYCHNPELVRPPFPDSMISLEEFDLFLEKRSAVLGGVCITGGEPLLHPDIDTLIQLIRARGLKVKLDTNGTYPDRLRNTDADYVAMDLKTDPDRYHRLLPQAEPSGSPSTGRLGEAVQRSIEWLRESGTPYELRTTVAPGIVDEADLRAMLPLLPGARRYILTPFRPGTNLDPEYAAMPAPESAYMERLLQIARTSGVPCVLTMGAGTGG
jgi:pyruvate formate lyase activating enzyme